MRITIPLKLYALCAFLSWGICDWQTAVAESPVYSPEEVLTETQWQEVDTAVEKGLKWLASQQQPDGSFPTMPHCQPGVTSLCVMAFLSHGHLPGEGDYGQHLDRAIEYILAHQKRSGLFALVAPSGDQLSRNIVHDVGYTVPYNHAIAGLTLCESYAMNGTSRAKELEPAIKRALEATLTMQKWPKEHPEDEGGWRYLDDYDDDRDSDLSITGWQLMFLRSAKNAGFDVSEEPITRAIGYVKRCFRRDVNSFSYKSGPEERCSRGMAGAGVLALAHAGLHNTPEARMAGQWILKSGFHEYNGLGLLSEGNRNDDRYHYGLLTCCQAMYQLGGDSWNEFFPPTVEALLSGQDEQGAWQPENFFRDQPFGTVYTSAIAVIALGSPNQLLPIFQR